MSIKKVARNSCFLEKSDRQGFEDDILVLIEEAQNPSFSIPSLAEKMEKSESAIERAIRKLKAEGRLRRIGPDSSGHWQVME